MHYENRMSKPTEWQQQTVDSRGKPIYQVNSKHRSVSLVRKRLDLAIAEQPLTVTMNRMKS